MLGSHREVIRQLRCRWHFGSNPTHHDIGDPPLVYDEVRSNNFILITKGPGEFYYSNYEVRDVSIAHGKAFLAQQIETS